VTTGSPLERTFRAAVAAARRAPSAHNTQPARWRLAGERVELHGDAARWLSAGDPTGRDHALSLGAAWEGLALALSEGGVAVDGPQLASHAVARDQAGGLQLVAHGTLHAGASADSLAAWVRSRRSYRGEFRGATQAERVALRALAAQRSDVRLLEAKEASRELAALYDGAALACLREPAFARELYRWMRFSEKDPGWHRDGLTAACLGLAPLEAWGARLALRPGPLALARALRLDGLLVSEAAKVRSATAVALFHRPSGEPVFQAGRAFYRFWLELERGGFSAVPMSALVDSRMHREALERRHPSSAGREVVTVLRIGPKPDTPAPESARLPVEELLV
jgi:nitroreductase